MSIAIAALAGILASRAITQEAIDVVAVLNALRVAFPIGALTDY